MAVRREKDTIAVHKTKTAKIALERKSTLLFAWLSMFVSFCGNAIGVGIFMLFSIKKPYIIYFLPKKTYYINSIFIYTFD